MRLHITKQIIALLLLITFPPMGLAVPSSEPSHSVEILDDSAVKKAMGIDFKLPIKLGEIVYDRRVPGSKQTIYIVQDAHAIADAQRNIYKLVDWLNRSQGIQKVGIEGAGGKLDAKFLQAYPEQKNLKSILAPFLKRGQISGAAAASLFLDKKIEFQGLEKWADYERGVQAYLMGVQKKEKLKKLVERLAQEVGEIKKKSYSPELLSVDNDLNEFNRNEKSLFEVLKRLSQFRKPEPGSDLARILDRLMEQESKRTVLDGELEELIKKIRKNWKHSSSNKKVYRKFEGLAQSYSTSRVSSALMAKFLQEHQATLVEGTHSNFVMSDGLLFLAAEEKKVQDIKGAALFDEFERYSEGVVIGLMRSDEQKAIHTRSRRVELLKRMIRFELSRTNWTEIKRALSDDDLNDIKKEIAPWVDFYQISEKRDKNMVERLRVFSPDQDAIVIAGGFHADGLVSELSALGVSSVVIQPSIKFVPDQNDYENQMLGQVPWKNSIVEVDGRVSAYEAFCRFIRDMMVGQDAKSNLKLKMWRDQLLRNLARERKLSEASRYTKFIDQRLGDETNKSTEASQRVKRFFESLTKLETSKQLSTDSILRVLKSFSSAPYFTTALTDPSVSMPIRFETRPAISEEVSISPFEKAADEWVAKSEILKTEASRIKRLIYPGSGEDYLTLALLASIFTNLEEIVLIDPLIQIEADVDLGQAIKNQYGEQIIVPELKNIKVQAVSKDLLTTEISLDNKPTAIIDKKPGTAAILRTQDDWRRSLLKLVKPNDVLVGFYEAGDMHPPVMGSLDSNHFNMTMPLSNRNAQVSVSLLSEKDFNFRSSNLKESMAVLLDLVSQITNQLNVPTFLKGAFNRDRIKNEIEELKKAIENPRKDQSSDLDLKSAIQLMRAELSNLRGRGSRIFDPLLTELDRAMYESTYYLNQTRSESRSNRVEVESRQVMTTEVFNLVISEWLQRYGGFVSLTVANLAQAILYSATTEFSDRNLEPNKWIHKNITQRPANPYSYLDREDVLELRVYEVAPKSYQLVIEVMPRSEFRQMAEIIDDWNKNRYSLVQDGFFGAPVPPNTPAHMGLQWKGTNMVNGPGSIADIDWFVKNISKLDPKNFPADHLHEFDAIVQKLVATNYLTQKDADQWLAERHDLERGAKAYSQNRDLNYERDNSRAQIYRNYFRAASNNMMRIIFMIQEMNARIERQEQKWVADIDDHFSIYMEKGVYFSLENGLSYEEKEVIGYRKDVDEKRFLIESPQFFFDAHRFALEKGLPLSARVERSIWTSRDSVSAWLASERSKRVRSADFEYINKGFALILGHPKSIHKTIWQMHRLQMFDAFIPEFARLNFEPSNFNVHAFTVGQHTIYNLQKLDDIAEIQVVETGQPGKADQLALEEGARILRDYQSSDWLQIRLALLFHDLGKRESKTITEADHAVVGAWEVLPKYINGFLGELDQVKAVVATIRDHMLLNALARTPQPEMFNEKLPSFVEGMMADPELDLETFRMLYLISLTDRMSVDPWKPGFLQQRHWEQLNVIYNEIENILGTDDANRQRLMNDLSAIDEGNRQASWNKFKAQYLSKIREYLSEEKNLKASLDKYMSGVTNYRDEIDKLKDALSQVLKDENAYERVFDLLGEMFTVGYLKGLSFDGIVARFIFLSHIELHKQLKINSPIIFVDPFSNYLTENRYEILFGIANDEPGVFERLTGLMHLVGFNVEDAIISTADNGMVVDSFSGYFTGDYPSEEQYRGLLQLMAEDAVKLWQGKSVANVFGANGKAYESGEVNPVISGMVQSSVKFHDDRVYGQDVTQSSVFTLRTSDRPGLLHAVALVISKFGANLVAAPVHTHPSIISDTFVINKSDADGQTRPLTQEEKEVFATRLKELIDQPKIDFASIGAKARAELRGMVNPLVAVSDLTDAEKRLIHESLDNELQRAVVENDKGRGAKMWLFGELETMSPFVANLNPDSATPRIPSDWFENKKVLVVPGYGNLPFIIRALGAREVVGMDLDPVTIAWQKLKAKSLALKESDISDFFNVSEISRSFVKDAFKSKWINVIDKPMEQPYEGMRFEVGNILESLNTFGTEKYDLIVSPYLFGVIHGLESEESWTQALANMMKSLSPEGRIILMPGDVEKIDKTQESIGDDLLPRYIAWLRGLSNNLNVAFSELYPHYHITYPPVKGAYAIIQPRSEARNGFRDLSSTLSGFLSEEEQRTLAIFHGALKRTLPEDEARDQWIKYFNDVIDQIINRFTDKEDLRLKNIVALIYRRRHGFLDKAKTDAEFLKRFFEPVFTQWDASRMSGHDSDFDAENARVLFSAALHGELKVGLEDSLSGWRQLGSFLAKQEIEFSGEKYMRSRIFLPDDIVVDEAPMFQRRFSPGKNPIFRMKLIDGNGQPKSVFLKLGVADPQTETFMTSVQRRLGLPTYQVEIHDGSLLLIEDLSARVFFTAQYTENGVVKTFLPNGQFPEFTLGALKEVGAHMAVRYFLGSRDSGMKQLLLSQDNHIISIDHEFLFTAYLNEKSDLWAVEDSQNDFWSFVNQLTDSELVSVANGFDETLLKLSRVKDEIYKSLLDSFAEAGRQFDFLEEFRKRENIRFFDLKKHGSSRAEIRRAENRMRFNLHDTYNLNSEETQERIFAAHHLGQFIDRFDAKMKNEPGYLAQEILAAMKLAEENLVGFNSGEYGPWTPWQERLNALSYYLNGNILPEKDLMNDLNENSKESQYLRSHATTIFLTLLELATGEQGAVTGLDIYKAYQEKLRKISGESSVAVLMDPDGPDVDIRKQPGLGTSIADNDLTVISRALNMVLDPESTRSESRSKSAQEGELGQESNENPGRLAEHVIVEKKGLSINSLSDMDSLAREIWNHGRIRWMNDWVVLDEFVENKPSLAQVQGLIEKMPKRILVLDDKGNEITAWSLEAFRPRVSPGLDAALNERDALKIKYPNLPFAEALKATRGGSADLSQEIGAYLQDNLRLYFDGKFPFVNLRITESSSGDRFFSIQYTSEEPATIRSESRAIDIPGLLAAKRALILSDDVDAIDAVVQSEKGSQKYVRVTLKNPRDLARLRRSTIIDEAGKVERRDGELADIVRNGGILLIDYAESDPKLVRELNSLTSGQKLYWNDIPAHPDLKIIGVMPDAQFDQYDVSFYSRQYRIDETKISHADPLQAIKNRAPPTEFQGVVADINENPNTRELLIGRIHFQNGKLAAIPGLLFQAIEQNSPILLRGVDWQSSDTAFILRQILLKGQIEFNGRVVKIPEGFSQKIYSGPMELGDRIKDKTILPSADFDVEGLVYVINESTQQQLFSATEIEDDQLIESQGLLGRPNLKIKITSPLADWVWHSIMTSSGKIQIEIVPGVSIPSDYQYLRGKVSPVRPPYEKGAALSELKNSKTILIESDDADFAVESITQEFNGQEILKRRVTESTTLRSLTEEVTIDITAEAGWKFSTESKEVISALERGATVVLTGLESNQILRRQLESVLQDQPYLMVNGKPRPMSEFKGRLILVSTPQPHLQERGKNTVALPVSGGAIEALLEKQSQGEKWTKPFSAEDFAKIQKIIELFKKVPPPKQNNLYPKRFDLTYSRIRRLFQYDNWLTAFQEVVINDYYQDSDVSAYMRTAVRLMFEEDDSQVEPDSVLGVRVADALHQAVDTISWKRFAWRFADSLGLKVLKKVNPGLDFNAPATRQMFEEIQKSIIRYYELKGDDESVSNYRQRFKMIHERVDMAHNLQGPFIIEEESEEAIFEYYEAERKKQIENVVGALKRDRAVFLKGAPGTGKSHLAKEVAKLQVEGFNYSDAEIKMLTAGSDIKEKHMIGKSELQNGRTKFVPEVVADWAQLPQGGLLIVDEGNLTDENEWDFLEGLFDQEPYIYINGVKRKLTPRHRIVFTGNQETLDGRKWIHLFKRFVPTIPFLPFEEAFFRRQIERPAYLKNKNNRKELANLILDLHRYFERMQPNRGFSLRDIQELTLRVNEMTSESWTRQQVVAIAWAQYSGVLTPEERKAFVTYLIPRRYGVLVDEVEKANEEKARLKHGEKFRQANLVPVASSMKMASVIDDLILMREANIRQPAEIPGKGGMIFEGAAGRGKDDILYQTLLDDGYLEVPWGDEEAFMEALKTKDLNAFNEAQENKRFFYRITASPDYRALVDRIKSARERGWIIVISEMNNLPSDFLEGKLNDALTGDSQPGFSLIATINSQDFSGVEKLSTALQNRVIYQKISEYNQEELIEIIATLAPNVSEHDQNYLVGFHVWTRDHAGEPSKQPTTREILRSVELLRSGQSVRDVIESVYGKIFIKRILKGQEILWDGLGSYQERPAINHIKMFEDVAKFIVPEASGPVEVLLDASNPSDSGAAWYSATEDKPGQIALRTSGFLTGEWNETGLFHESSHGRFSRNFSNFDISEEFDPLWQDLEDLGHTASLVSMLFPYSDYAAPSQAEEDLAGIINSLRPEGLADWLATRRERPLQTLFQNLLTAFARGLVSDRNKIDLFSKVIAGHYDVNPIELALKHLETAKRIWRLKPKSLHEEHIKNAALQRQILILSMKEDFLKIPVGKVKSSSEKRENSPSLPEQIRTVGEVAEKIARMDFSPKVIPSTEAANQEVVARDKDLVKDLSEEAILELQQRFRGSISLFNFKRVPIYLQTVLRDLLQVGVSIGKPLLIAVVATMGLAFMLYVGYWLVPAGFASISGVKPIGVAFIQLIFRVAILILFSYAVTKAVIFLSRQESGIGLWAARIILFPAILLEGVVFKVLSFIPGVSKVARQLKLKLGDYVELPQINFSIFGGDWASRFMRWFGDSLFSQSGRQAADLTHESGPVHNGISLRPLKTIVDNSQGLRNQELTPRSAEMVAISESYQGELAPMIRQFVHERRNPNQGSTPDGEFHTDVFVETFNYEESLIGPTSISASEPKEIVLVGNMTNELKQNPILIEYFHYLFSKGFTVAVYTIIPKAIPISPQHRDGSTVAPVTQEPIYQYTSGISTVSDLIASIDNPLQKLLPRERAEIDQKGRRQSSEYVVVDVNEIQKEIESIYAYGAIRDEINKKRQKENAENELFKKELDQAHQFLSEHWIDDDSKTLQVDEEKKTFKLNLDGHVLKSLKGLSGLSRLIAVSLEGATIEDGDVTLLLSLQNLDDLNLSQLKASRKSIGHLRGEWWRNLSKKVKKLKFDLNGRSITESIPSLSEVNAGKAISRARIRQKIFETEQQVIAGILEDNGFAYLEEVGRTQLEVDFSGLMLADIPIEDFEMLGKLSKLDHMTIRVNSRDNYSKVIERLAKMKNLRSLNVISNGVIDIAQFTVMGSLAVLTVEANDVINFEYLDRFLELQSIEITTQLEVDTRRDKFKLLDFRGAKQVPDVNWNGERIMVDSSGITKEERDLIRMREEMNRITAWLKTKGLDEEMIETVTKPHEMVSHKKIRLDFRGTGITDFSGLENLRWVRDVMLDEVEGLFKQDRSKTLDVFRSWELVDHLLIDSVPAGLGQDRDLLMSFPNLRSIWIMEAHELNQEFIRTLANSKVPLEDILFLTDKKIKSKKINPRPLVKIATLKSISFGDALEDDRAFNEMLLWHPTKSIILHDRSRSNRTRDSLTTLDIKQTDAYTRESDLTRLRAFQDRHNIKNSYSFYYKDKKLLVDLSGVNLTKAMLDDLSDVWSTKYLLLESNDPEVLKSVYEFVRNHPNKDMRVKINGMWLDRRSLGEGKGAAFESIDQAIDQETFDKDVEKIREWLLSLGLSTAEAQKILSDAKYKKGDSKWYNFDFDVIANLRAVPAQKWQQLKGLLAPRAMTVNLAQNNIAVYFELINAWKNAKSLTVYNYKEADSKKIMEMPNVEELSIRDNFIPDLELVKKLPSLRRIYLSGIPNNIDYRPLLLREELEFISIEDFNLNELTVELLELLYWHPNPNFYIKHTYKEDKKMSRSQLTDRQIEAVKRRTAEMDDRRMGQFYKRYRSPKDMSVSADKALWTLQFSPEEIIIQNGLEDLLYVLNIGEVYFHSSNIGSDLVREFLNRHPNRNMKVFFDGKLMARDADPLDSTLSPEVTRVASSGMTAGDKRSSGLVQQILANLIDKVSVLSSVRDRFEREGDLDAFYDVLKGHGHLDMLSEKDDSRESTNSYNWSDLLEPGAEINYSLDRAVRVEFGPFSYYFKGAKANNANLYSVNTPLSETILLTSNSGGNIFSNMIAGRFAQRGLPEPNARDYVLNFLVDNNGQITFRNLGTKPVKISYVRPPDKNRSESRSTNQSPKQLLTNDDLVRVGNNLAVYLARKKVFAESELAGMAGDLADVTIQFGVSDLQDYVDSVTKPQDRLNLEGVASEDLKVSDELAAFSMRLILNNFSAVFSDPHRMSTAIAFNVPGREAGLREVLSQGDLKNYLALALVSKEMQPLNVDGLSEQQTRIQQVGLRPNLATNNAVVGIISENELEKRVYAYLIKRKGTDTSKETFFNNVVDLVEILSGVVVSNVAEVKTGADLTKTPLQKKIKAELLSSLFDQLKEQIPDALFSFDSAGNLQLDRGILLKIVTDIFAQQKIDISA